MGLKVEGNNVDVEVRNWWPCSTTVSGSVVGCNYAWWERPVEDEGQSVEGLVSHLKGSALDPVGSECLQDLAQKAPQQSLPVFLLQNRYLLINQYYFWIIWCKILLLQTTWLAIPLLLILKTGVNA